MKEFLDKLFNIFPDFSPDWDIDEFPYIFFGDFARFVIERHGSIDMQSVNYIINLFLTSSFQPGDKENSNNELKEIFNKYLNEW